jgi:multiple sugar transport system substrate-binding protein
MFDQNAERMTVDSNQWEQVWKTIIDLKREKITPEAPDYNNRRMMEPGMYNPFEYDNFMSGKLAMTIVHYGNLNQLIDANKNHERINGYDPIDWDVVTIPIHPTAPGIGGSIHLHPIMAINAKAQNADDAWRFIEFSNSEDWARVKSRSSYNLVSNKNYIQPKDGLNYQVEAFYLLEPVPQDDMSSLYRKLGDAMWRIQELGRQKMQAAVSGDKTIRDALKEWQNEGNMLLQEYKDNPGGGGGGGIGIMPMPRIDIREETVKETETIIVN